MGITGIGSLILSVLALVAIVALGAFLLWFLLGRKKDGSDKMVGVLKFSSFLRSGSAASSGPSGGLFGRR